VRHEIWIPYWHPTRLNAVRNRHWSAERAAKDRMARMIGTYALANRVPRAAGRRRAALEVTFGPGQRRPDQDAYDKLLLDSLKLCGMLTDDGARGLEGRLAVEFKRGPEWGTLLVLEDVP